MQHHPVFEQLSKLHQAFNDNDKDAITRCYHQDAKVIVTPQDVEARKGAASEALARFRALYADGATVSNGDQMVVEVDDVALVFSKIYLAQQDQFSTESHSAIYVFKRDEQGQWRCLIDNFFGTRLLSHV